MDGKQLGRIQRAYFGSGGYDGAMTGITFQLGGGGYGVQDFWGTWSREPDQYCKWTREDQTAQWGETVRRLRDLLKDAKKVSVEQLAGTPIEIEFEDSRLKSWRVLTEVL